jgi:hypothetical protein
MSIHYSERVEEYIYPRILDWAQIMRDIADHISYTQVANILGVGWSTVQRWRTGSEPRHSMGSALLMVHAKYCGSDLTRQRVAEAAQ